MGLSKKTSNLLKGGASAVGVAACFTPVGSILGLGGAAALGVDLVAGGVISKVVDKGVDGFKSFIDGNTAKPSKSEKDKQARKEEKKEAKALSKDLKKQSKKDGKIKESSKKFGQRTEEMSDVIERAEAQERKQLQSAQKDTSKSKRSKQDEKADKNVSTTTNAYQNSNGRNTGPMLDQFTMNLHSAFEQSEPNYDKLQTKYNNKSTQLEQSSELTV